MIGEREGHRGGARKVRSRVVEEGISILVRRKVTTRWVDDSAWRQIGGGRVGEGGGCPPRKETRKREER